MKKFETWFKKVESTSGGSDSTANPASTSQSQALNNGSSATPGNNPANSDGVVSGSHLWLAKLQPFSNLNFIALLRFTIAKPSSDCSYSGFQSVLARKRFEKGAQSC